MRPGRVAFASREETKWALLVHFKGWFYTNELMLEKSIDPVPGSLFGFAAETGGRGPLFSRCRFWGECAVDVSKLAGYRTQSTL